MSISFKVLVCAVALACGTKEQPPVDSAVADTTPPLIVVDSGAQKLLPRDDANASFQAFRQDLLTALARKDTTFLYGILSPDIKNNFGGDDGIPGFRLQWTPQDPKSVVWETLGRVLRMGGKQDSDSSFIAPYVYAFWPDAIDAMDYAAVTDSLAVVRTQADEQSAAIGSVSYSILEVDGWSDSPGSEKPESRWANVKLPNGTSGWISATSIYSSISWRAMFQRKGGKWIMIFFVAGD